MNEPKPMRELTRIREERGLSQQGLADASGVNKATINQIERGRRSPNLETLEKLAGALAVEMGDFFPKAQAPLPDLGEERREERRAEGARDAIVFARRFVRLHENLNAIRDRVDDYRETWEARLADEDLDEAAIEEAGRAIRAFWPAVVTAAEAEMAELDRIGMKPEEIEEQSVLPPAMERFQALGKRVNAAYREMLQDAASNVYQFPQREAS